MKTIEFVYTLGQDSMGDEVNVNPNGPDANDAIDAENEIMSFEETSLHSSTESGNLIIVLIVLVFI